MFSKRDTYKSLIWQRTILNRCKYENQLNSNLVGRINQRAAILAVTLFDRMRGRKLWLKVCENRIGWLNNRRENFDQLDLMLACRRSAKRIVARRK